MNAMTQVEAVRVHAAPGIGHNRPAPLKTYRRACPECGDPVAAEQAHGEFCCTPHRDAFNNRRKARGAELYDLVMAWRYERGLSKTMRLWRLICRLAAQYREEDRVERDARKSWRGPAAVIARKPCLTVTVMQRRK